jgi:hypothetical protein
MTDRTSRLARAILAQGPRVVLYTLLVPVVLFGACLGSEFCCAVAAHTPELNPATAWQPRTHERCQLELRALPPAADVLADYARWTALPSELPTAKLYLLRMAAGAQHGLRIERLLRDGVGFAARPPSTRATFQYVDPRGQKYAMLWHLYGWHWPGFLKLQSGSRRMLVAPIDPPSGATPPVLFIHGIEGVEAHMDAPACTPLGIRAGISLRAFDGVGGYNPEALIAVASKLSGEPRAARAGVAGRASGGNATPCAASRSPGRTSPEP